MSILSFLMTVSFCFGLRSRCYLTGFGTTISYYIEMVACMLLSNLLIDKNIVGFSWEDVNEKGDGEFRVSVELTSHVNLHWSPHVVSDETVKRIDNKSSQMLFGKPISNRRYYEFMKVVAGLLCK